MLHKNKKSNFNFLFIIFTLAILLVILSIELTNKNSISATNNNDSSFEKDVLNLQQEKALNNLASIHPTINSTITNIKMLQEKNK